MNRSNTENARILKSFYETREFARSFDYLYFLTFAPRALAFYRRGLTISPRSEGNRALQSKAKAVLGSTLLDPPQAAGLYRRVSFEIGKV